MKAGGLPATLSLGWEKTSDFKTIGTVVGPDGIVFT